MDQGVLPEVWKQASVVPGIRSDSYNFKPISLTCVCARYKNILCTQIYQSTYKDMKSSMMNSMDFAQIEVVMVSYLPLSMISLNVLMEAAKAMC